MRAVPDQLRKRLQQVAKPILHLDSRCKRSHRQENRRHRLQIRAPQDGVPARRYEGHPAARNSECCLHSSGPRLARKRPAESEWLKKRQGSRVCPSHRPAIQSHSGNDCGPDKQQPENQTVGGRRAAHTTITDAFIVFLLQRQRADTDSGK